MALVLVALLLAVSAAAALVGSVRSLSEGSEVSAALNFAGAALYLYWARLCLRNRDRGGRYASRKERDLRKQLRAGYQLTAREVREAFFPPDGVNRPDLPPGTLVLRDPEVVRRCEAFIQKHSKKDQVVEL